MHGVGDARGKQPDDPQRVVVAGDLEVHLVGIAIGVDDADDRNLQLARFVDGNLFLARVDDEDRVGQARHAADALEVLLELPAFLLEPRDFLLRQRLVAAVGDHRFQVAEAREAALNGVEVGQQPAQPALVHVVHAAADGFFGDDVLRLPLGADKQDRLAFGGQVGDEVLGFLEQLDRLAEIKNVDAVALAENVFLHLRVPALRLVPEVHSGFQQILHCDRGQAASIPSINLLLTLATAPSESRGR